MSESKKEEITPEIKHGLLEGVFYGVGCGIGGSIFILLGTAIEVAGPGVLISLILGGILIFFTALNYSELSTSLPISGGAYNFGKEGMGGFAFIIGFFLWMANIITCVFSALAFTLMIEVIILFFFPITIATEISILFAIIAILLISMLYFKTQRFAAKTLIYLTIILLIIFSVFIISGLFIAPITNISHYNPKYLSSKITLFGVIQMFALLFICFSSITSNLAYFNANIEKPSKNIPRVNILAILMTLTIYLAITYVVLINIGADATRLGETRVLLADVLLKILGPVGFILMCGAAIISTLIAMNSAIGSATSVFQALARDNYVPARFKEEKLGVPVNALIVTTFFAILFTLFVDIDLAAEMSVFIYFVGIALVNIAAVLLRYKRKELDRPFKAPFFPILPFFIGACCLILATVLSVNAILIGLIIFIFGASYYLLTIADRHSIVITLSGIKFLAILMVGFLIWIINNLCVISSSISGFESVFSYVLLRILITIGVIGLFTVLLDVVPLREFVYKFVKKLDKSKVAIDVGGAQIIELNKKSLKAIHKMNIIIGLLQLISSIFIFYIVFLFGTNIIYIDVINIGHGTLTPGAGKYLFISALIVLAICFIASGIILLYTNKEMKSLGI